MLFMVVEGFKDGDPGPVYRRLRDQGRLLTDEVAFVASWVSSDLTMCFQVMEAADRAHLDEWLARWSDLVDFEVVEVMTPEDAFAACGVRLEPDAGGVRLQPDCDAPGVRLQPDQDQG